MPKIVILGSCRYEPYEILFVPKKIPGLWNTEEGYRKASERCYSAIDRADEVWVYAPEGIGEHTARDLGYAKRKGKVIRIIAGMPRINWHGFLEEVRNPENEDHELCAWLFSSHPYGPDEEWHVLQVREVPKDWDLDGFYEGWAPDKKDLARVKKLARMNEWTHIGTVHTHPIGPSWIAKTYWCRKEDLNTIIVLQSAPSEVDRRR